MCSNYEAVHNNTRLRQHFGVPHAAPAAQAHVWPGYVGTFIRRSPTASTSHSATPEREAMAGRFGLIPAWAKDDKVARHTYNARSETVADKPSFRDAWRHAQHCIVPMDSFVEPDWRSGKAQPRRIGLPDGQPLGAAGLWSAWRSPSRELVHSYTLLTINADTHPFMRQFHKPDDEKRMIVILPPERYSDWLHANVAQSIDFMQPWPAERLLALDPVVEERGLF